MDGFGWEIVTAGSMLLAFVGGGGLWLGILQTRVGNNERKNEEFKKQINGSLDCLHEVVIKVATIEVTCANIASRLDAHDRWERARYKEKGAF